MDIAQLLKDNLVAIFGLLGAAVGATLSFIATWVLKERDLRLKMREKLLDRRIESHENIIAFSKTLRKTTYVGFDDNRHLVRFPIFMASKEAFENWHIQFLMSWEHNSTWLSNELAKELNLLQDYILNLREFIDKANDQQIQYIGALIYFDFIEFSGRIEKLATKYFEKDLMNLGLNDLSKWRTYKPQERINRLEKTYFAQNKQKIIGIIFNKEPKV